MDEIRLRKTKELREMGINPYAERYERSHNLKKAKELKLDTQVKVAGRLMLKRDMGKLSFAHLQDFSGKMQIAFQKDILEDEKYKLFLKKIDIGDFIGVEGKIFKTHKGEISILVETFELLSKSMRPLPEKFHGVTNKETLYRQRYLDLTMNRETMDRFLLRSKVIKTIRSYLENNEFIEVETPVLSSVASGAAARPFYTHHNALDIDVTLRIAPENYLKRCIAGGFERVFEFAKCFRNEGIDPSHLQEFSMLEYYSAYWNFEDNMDFTEKIFTHLLTELFGTLKLNVYGKEIDFTTPWQRIDYRELILKDSGIDFKEHKDVESLKKAIKEKNIFIENIEKYGYGNLVDALYKKVSRPKLIQPCFVIHHPIHTKPLARKNDDDPQVADTFQLLVNTWEIINAYSELVDPVDQRERFEEQMRAKNAGDEDAVEYDEDYVIAMEHGMPPISGWGIGIDRLVSLLTSQENLKDCVLFPIMKPEGGGETSLKRKSLVEKKVVPDDTQLLKNVSTHSFVVSKEVKEKFPDLKIGYTLISDVSVQKERDDLNKLKKDFTPKIEQAKEMLEKLSVLHDYREIFKKTGIDPTKRKPSPIALLDRIASGKPLYTISTVVDAVNVIVMKYGISMGAFDLDNIQGSTELCFAEGREDHLAIMEEKEKKINAGELIYKDQKHVICRDLNYRDSEYTKITKKTRNILLFIDGTKSTSEEEVQQALQEAADLIMKFSGGKVSHMEINGVKV